jgi:hypothetical protein
MRDDDVPYFAFILVCILIGLLSWGAGGKAQEVKMHREAVKAGVAEFRATPEGDVTFHWKEPKP